MIFNGTLAPNLRQQAIEEGIPSLWAPTKINTDPKYDISHVLQLTHNKEQETQEVSSEFPE